MVFAPVRILRFFIFPAFVLLSLFERCGGTKSEVEGEKLAKEVCGRCHLYPDPTALPRTYWEKQIFPSMAKFMGRFGSADSRDSMFEIGEAGERVKQAGVFPNHPLINDDDWNMILAYYLQNAPEKIDFPKVQFTSNSNLFKLEKPLAARGSASTTLLKGLGQGQFIYGDAGTGRYIEFGAGFSIKKMGELEQGPVHFIRKDKYDLITVMGSFAPTDAATGMLVKLPRDGKIPPSVFIDSLQRPVHTSVVDLDTDGIDDYIISEFGKFTGALSLFWSNKQGKLEKQVLAITPGATKTEIADMNNDGRMDIVALFGQANERIDVWLNLGDRKFETVRLLSFPPYFGSSSFQLIDTDEDGDKDIVYTAGDNADYTPVIKACHGIYIFENKGQMQFKQKLFLSMPGAYAAHWADFDMDGYKDLLGVSFFPDWSSKNPADCLLWKGTKDGFLKPEQISLSHLGRWIVSDAGDMDGDGDTDVVLGSLMMEPKPDNGRLAEWLRLKIPLLVLRNQTKG
jgi:hypothetical protein